MFINRQAYIILSRVITLEELYITCLDFNTIKADPEAITKYKWLE
jgi:hypothetical protein